MYMLCHVGEVNAIMSGTGLADDLSAAQLESEALRGSPPTPATRQHVSQPTRSLSHLAYTRALQKSAHYQDTTHSQASSLTSPRPIRPSAPAPTPCPKVPCPERLQSSSQSCWESSLPKLPHRVPHLATGQGGRPMGLRRLMAVNNVSAPRRSAALYVIRLR